MRRSLFAILLSLLLLSPTFAHQGVTAETEPGSFTFRWESERAWLHANGAAINDILKDISAVTGIPIRIDPGDSGTLTVELEGVTLEKLVRRMSPGYALIYGRDPDDGSFFLERIVAARNAGARDVEGEDRSELDAADVVREIVNRAREAERHHQKLVTSMNMMGQQMEVPTEMWIDGERFRMEMTVPPGNMKQIMISNGEEMFTFVPMMNMVQKIDLARVKEAGNASMPGGGSPFGASADPLQNVDSDSLRYVGRENLDGELTYILEGSGPASGGEMKNMGPFVPETTRMWISAADGLPRKTVFYSKEGAEMFSQNVESVDLNGVMDDTLFEFVIPEGAQVIDMTDAMINMQKAMQESPTPAQ